MAKFTIGKDIDRYIEMLDGLNKSSEDMIGRAVYEGAKIVADEVAKNISGLPVDNRAYKKDAAEGITASQKAGLKHGLGIAGMRNDGGFNNVKIGMDGYNTTKTKSWPNGQPNAMIARSVESGTSFMAPRPFISTAVSATRRPAEQAMAKEIEKQLKQKGF